MAAQVTRLLPQCIRDVGALAGPTAPSPATPREWLRPTPFWAILRARGPPEPPNGGDKLICKGTLISPRVGPPLADR
jgi:hypothetical protein